MNSVCYYEVMNAWIYTFTAPHAFMARCVVKHMDGSIRCALERWLLLILFAFSFVRLAVCDSRCIWRAAKDNLMVAAGSSSLLLSVRNAASCLGLMYFGIVVSLPINSGTFNLEVWSSWPVYALHRIWQIGSTLKTLKGHSTSVYLSRYHLLSIRSLSLIKCVCTFA
jgi:hypothetical protein